MVEECAEVRNLLRGMCFILVLNALLSVFPDIMLLE
jgi:hypothetical protein